MVWIAPLIIIALAVLFSFSTSMNAKIERPEDCEEVESCTSCAGTGCSFNATSNKIIKD
jgi:hypothetical protein